MGNKVTLKQIAQEVGLSPSSVSLVLNNRPCRISEENRKRIKEVAAQNHYVPNQIARSLVMRESRTLGLIVPNIESRFFASLAGSLEKRCREDGYALFITSSGGSAEDDLELLWNAIVNMFENDHSAARGKMAVRELIVFKHDSELGNAPAYKLFDAVTVAHKAEVVTPRSYQDYTVTVADTLPEGVHCERFH